MPHVGCAGLKLLADLRMDDCHLFNRLLDAFVWQKRAPALGILGPGIACQQNAATGIFAIICMIQVANGEVCYRATAINAIILFLETAAGLEEYFGRGIVMQLANGALFSSREGLEHLHMPQHREWDRDDRIVATRFEATHPRLVM